MVIRNIHCRVGSSGTRYLEYLVHEQADISPLVGFIYNMDTAYKSVDFRINAIAELKRNREFGRVHVDDTDQRFVFEIDADIPGTVVGPTELPIHPNTNFMLGAARICQVIQADIRVIEVMHQTAL